MSMLLVPTAITLALFAGLALLVRRARGVVVGRSADRSLEVLERVALGPKQGMAAVRVGDRVVVVSHGEGGVQRLADFAEADWPVAGPQDGRGRNRAAGRSLPMPRLSPAVTAAQRRLLAPRLRRFLVALLVVCVLPEPIAALPVSTPTVQQAAQDIDGSSSLLQALPPITTEGADGSEELELSGPVGTALLLGVLALLPTLLLLATGFTRILIVLHLLKQAIGAQAVPPVHLINALALLLTLFLMAPTLDRATDEAIDPWLDGEITQAQMLEGVSVPFKDFMLDHVSEDDLARLVDLRGSEIPASLDDVRFTTLMAAFTISELRRAFQLGFALFLPFIIIDLVVASVLMSMGMFMLPPVMISLPFKLLLFVLADGWGLIVGGLLDSFV